MDKAIWVLAFVVAATFTTANAGELVRMKNETLNLQPVLLENSNSAVTRFFPQLDKVFYIVQFDGPIKSEWKTNLLKAGVELGSYLPDDAFLAKIQNGTQWKAVNKNHHIRAVVPFSPNLRVSHDFDILSDQGRAITTYIRLASKEEVPNFLNSVKQKNISFVLNSISGATLQVDVLKSKVLPLAEIEGVEWIEPAKEISIYDFEISGEDQNLTVPGDYKDLTGFESGTKLMEFESAYSRGLHGEGEVVGIADTGLDRGSMTDILDDLKGQILEGFALGFFSRTWADPNGHGTHTSGSIIGSGASSGGILRGGGYGAKLVMQSLWSPMLNNLSKLADFDKIFGQARRQSGVHIHSNSWGSAASLGAYDSDAVMVDEQAWNNPDMLIIFAAGNSGVDANKDGHIDEGSIGSPGTAKNCLTVGASKNYVLQGGIQKMMKELKGGNDNWGAEPIASSRLSDNPNGMAAFSSVGPTYDGRLKPEIVAPGTNIISTRSLDPKATTLWGAYNDRYVYAGGTSMATPLTAGAAAVVRQYLKQLGFANPSGALVKAVLIHGATDLFPGQFGRGPVQEFPTTRPNNHEGFGRVNVTASTNLIKDRVIDETVGLKTDEIKTYNITVTQGQMVRATMSYTDHAGSAGTAQAIVNDLDLKITDDRGHIFYPNHLNGPDEANNTEMVEFKADHGGNFVLSVKGRNIPKGRPGTDSQPYALILP